LIFLFLGFILAIVEYLDEQNHRVPYVRNPFRREPDFCVTSVNYDLEDLLGRGSWLVNVQAHSLRINPSKSTVEGGQIFYFQVKTDN